MVMPLAERTKISMLSSSSSAWITALTLGCDT